MGTERSALALLGAAAVLVVVLIGTTAGGLAPVRVTGSSTGHANPAPAQRATGGSDRTSGGGQSRSPGVRSPDVSWLPSWGQLVVIVVLAGGALALLATLRVTFVRRRRLVPGRARGVTPPGEDDGADEADSLQTVLDERISALAEGSPRNAIVEAWIQIEDFAVSHGVPRDPADTPAEFVARALAAYDLDTVALQDLANLYREARFSTHALDESHRDRARACLRRLTGTTVSP